MLGLVKDLGVDSAGARRRRVATSNARLQKAMGRSRKLGRLKVSLSPLLAIKGKDLPRKG